MLSVMLQDPAKSDSQEKADALVMPIRRTIQVSTSNGHGVGRGSGGLVIQVDCEDKKK